VERRWAKDRRIMRPAVETKSARRISITIKVGFSAFMAYLVPCYWSYYGPTNFLHFCDVSLFLTLFAIWSESSLLISTAAVGVMIPNLLFWADLGGTLIDVEFLGVTEFIFIEWIPLSLRVTTLFHLWLPVLHLYLLKKLGYHEKALLIWTGTAWILCLISFFFLPSPETPVADINTPRNINLVFGTEYDRSQDWINPSLYLYLWMLTLLLCNFLPTHLVFRKFFSRKQSERVE
jgi:hypothetical protein